MHSISKKWLIYKKWFEIWPQKNLAETNNNF